MLLACCRLLSSFYALTTERVRAQATDAQLEKNNHRRARHNMRKQNAFNAEMAEKNNCIVVRIINLINIALMFVTVLFKKLVNTVAYRFAFSYYVLLAYGFLA